MARRLSPWSLGGRSHQISSDLPQGRALTLLRALVLLLGVWFFAGLGLAIYEEIRLSSMPKKADPASGFTFPATVNHGYHVYLNSYEVARRKRVYWFWVSGLIPFGVVAFIQQRWEVFPPYSRRRSP